MNNAQFIQLHNNCVLAMRAYFVEAEKTSELLGKWHPEPLPFAERVTLASQEMNENKSYARYVNAKVLLHDAARLGYRFPN
jgi:hypothetical protein